LGSSAATNLQITAAGFTLAQNCPTQLGAGAECDIVLTGSGPGSITVQASNATPQTIAIPATTKTAATLLYSPHEIDLGILTPSSSVSRTITVTISA
jgi:hypothetical protein